MYINYIRKKKTKFSMKLWQILLIKKLTHFYSTHLRHHLSYGKGWLCKLIKIKNSYLSINLLRNLDFHNTFDITNKEVDPFIFKCMRLESKSMCLLNLFFEIVCKIDNSILKLPINKRNISKALFLTSLGILKQF